MHYTVVWSAQIAEIKFGLRPNNGLKLRSK